MSALTVPSLHPSPPPGEAGTSLGRNTQNPGTEVDHGSRPTGGSQGLISRALRLRPCAQSPAPKRRLPGAGRAGRLGRGVALPGPSSSAPRLQLHPSPGARGRSRVASLALPLEAEGTVRPGVPRTPRAAPNLPRPSRTAPAETSHASSAHPVLRRPGAQRGARAWAASTCKKGVAGSDLSSRKTRAGEPTSRRVRGRGVAEQLDGSHGSVGRGRPEGRLGEDRMHEAGSRASRPGRGRVGARGQKRRSSGSSAQARVRRRREGFTEAAF